jgi:Rad3-related DNA helicase
MIEEHLDQAQTEEKQPELEKQLQALQKNLENLNEDVQRIKKFRDRLIGAEPENHYSEGLKDLAQNPSFFEKLDKKVCEVDNMREELRRVVSDLENIY